jgi:predicted nuclease with TOPRIM domain
MDSVPDPNRDVSDHIEQLVAEEHKLLDAAGEKEGGLEPKEHRRLEEVRIELDRLWDLLRQRRARREAGLDPADASERDARTVEGYLG